MRTGAAGVIVGVGADEWSTTDTVLGIRVPMATRDRRRGRGPARLPGRDRRPLRAPDRRRRRAAPRGDIAKALGCGADAVMLGEPLSRCAEAPGRRRVVALGGEPPEAAARRVRRGRGRRSGRWSRLLFGPSDDADGS